MKKIKLLVRILFYILSFLLILVAVLHFTLIYVASLESVKQKIITTLREQTLADIKIDSISASIFDFQVKGVNLGINGQNIAHINTIYLHFSLIKLLKEQVKIERITLEGIDILIIKNKNGEFNFSPILEAPMFKSTSEEEIKNEENKDEQENNENLNLLLNSTQLLNCNITYIDEQNNMNISLSKTSFDMKNFKFNDYFEFDFFTEASAKINDIEIDSLQVALSACANLSNADFSKSQLNITSLVFRLKDTVIVSNGIISNFNNPNVNLQTEISNLCSENLTSIAELPKFKIPEIRIQALVNFDLESSLVNIENLNINMMDSNIIDEKNNMNISLSNTSFNMKSFKLDNSFKIDFSTQASAKINNIEINSLNVALSAFTNLFSVDLSKTKLNITSLVFRLKDAVIVNKGIISNFNNPNINLQTEISNLSSEDFKGIAELPKFKIPKIRMQTLANVNLENSLVNVENFNVETANSNININGNINYDKPELEYNINAIINLMLDKICQNIELTKEYKLTGNIKANLNITNKPEILSGNCSLLNITAYTPQVGNFTEINSTININNINNIQISSFTGKLNGYPFKTSASYIVNKDKGNIKANFSADRVFGKMDKKFETEMNKKDTEKKTVEETKNKNNEIIEKKQNSNSFLPPLDILVTIDVKDMDVPFFTGKDIKFKMDMKKFTPGLDEVVGTLDLSTKNGTIKDIYKLIDSNVIIKVLFLSLKIVSDVINALNVLDILNGLGNLIVSSDKNENSTEMTQEHQQETQNQKINGKLDFISFTTLLNFENGKAVFDRCSFVSNLLSFKIGGEMSFKENFLDMTVNAAPGKHEEKSGIMPLTMKIDGTMDKPNGSLSLIGSLTTLVTDALTKNVVSNKLKSGFMKLLGIKNQDEKENDNDIVDSSDTVNTNYIEISTQTQINQ